MTEIWMQTTGCNSCKDPNGNGYPNFWGIYTILDYMTGCNSCKYPNGNGYPNCWVWYTILAYTHGGNTIGFWEDSHIFPLL